MVTTDELVGFKMFKLASLEYISESEFNRLETAAAHLSFKKGETILKQGAPPNHIVFLEHGIVKFNFEDARQKNLILTIVSAPKILGGANLFYRDNNLFSLIAIEPCEVLMFEASVIMDIMTHNARFSMMLFTLASEMFKQSVVNFISLAHKHKEGRIADVLLYLTHEVYKDRRYSICITRREFAEFAGCSAENVILTFSKWQKEGIIKLEGKCMEILDMDKLLYISNIG